MKNLKNCIIIYIYIYIYYDGLRDNIIKCTEQC